MAVPDPARAYRTAALENAPPLKIVRMLYHGCLRFLEEAKAAHEGGDRARFLDRIYRAEAIVNELRCAIAHDVNPELGVGLDNLYVFAHGRMVDAGVEGSPEPLEEAAAVLRTLLEGWNALELGQEAA